MSQPIEIDIESYPFSSEWSRFDELSEKISETARRRMSEIEYSHATKQACEVALQFLIGLNLRYHPITVQREQRELVTKLMAAIKPGKELK